MNSIHVGIGGYCVSGKAEDVIKTFALGSCVAVIVYDRVQKRAGLIHVALPDSSINGEKAKEKPGYFVDTGLPELLHAMKLYNGNRRNVWIKLVGGSNIMDTNARFDIGKRNVLAIKKCLWKSRLGIIAEDVGGSISRTVCVTVASGEVVISSGGKKWEL